MENKKIDFLKRLEQIGKIKNADEAFKEFPVEDEWHKGSINTFLAEETETYGEYNIGDIVFVKEYKYKDGNKGKRHLFVIIEKDNYAVPLEYFAVLISSKLEKIRFNTNKLLLKDELNNLKRNSIVKLDVIYKIKNENILFKIGIVEKDVVQQYMKKLEKLY